MNKGGIINERFNCNFPLRDNIKFEQYYDVIFTNSVSHTSLNENATIIALAKEF